MVGEPRGGSTITTPWFPFHSADISDNRNTGQCSMFYFTSSVNESHRLTDSNTPHVKYDLTDSNTPSLTSLVCSMI